MLAGQICSSAQRGKRAVFLLDDVLEQERGQVAPRIHGDDLLLVRPLRKGPDIDGGFRVCEIGSESGL